MEARGTRMMVHESSSGILLMVMTWLAAAVGVIAMLWRLFS